MLSDRKGQPSAAVFDSRTVQGSIESVEHSGYDGYKKRKGCKVHAAVDALGNLLAQHVTPANEQDRSQVGELTAAVQEATGENVEVAFVDQGYAGADAAKEAALNGIRLEVVKHVEAKKGFVLLPRRWVVERSFGWANRFRRLVRDYERLPTTVARIALHCLRSTDALTGSIHHLSSKCVTPSKFDDCGSPTSATDFRARFHTTSA